MRRHTLAITLAIFALHAYSADLFAQHRPCEAYPPWLPLDLNHPKHYLQITEYENHRTGELHTVLGTLEVEYTREYRTPGATTADSTILRSVGRSFYEAIDAEVDLRSRVLIEFDRSWLQCRSRNVDIALTISAHVKGADEVRRIEVPGYSLVGEQLETATARIQSASELIDLMAEFARRAAVFKEDFRELRIIRTQPPSQELRERLIRERVVFDVLFRKIAEGTSRDIIGGIAFIMTRSGEILQADARTALVALDSLATSESATDEAIAAWIFAVSAASEPYITRFGSEDPRAVQQDKDGLAQFFLSSLKDTDIYIPQSGAKVGDVVLVTITNYPDDHTRRRDLLIRLNVRRFGWVRRVSDSSMLLKRIGASRAANERIVASSEEAAEGASRPVAVTIQEPVRFVPAAGASLTWTYYERSQNFWRFLAPAGGVNVAFTQFPERTIVFSPPVQEGGSVTRSETSSDRIDVAAGVVASVFDNALQFTYGWNLTSSKPRSYWGVGFSFVRIVESLAALRANDTR